LDNGSHTTNTAIAEDGSNSRGKPMRGDTEAGFRQPANRRTGRNGNGKKAQEDTSYHIRRKNSRIDSDASERTEKSVVRQQFRGFRL
jgi:hypothetical protein